MTLKALLAMHLFSVGGTEVTGATLVSLTFVLVGGFVISRVLRTAVSHALRLRGLPQEGRWETILRLIHYVVVGLALAISLDTIGIQLSALFAAGAIFAVGIGFAMQTIAQNFVSGVILMAEGAIKPGDILEVGGQLVRVGQLGIRSTVARTLYEEELIIPNSDLVGSVVKNYTLNDKLYRLSVQVGVAYSSDMLVVEAALRSTAEAFPTRNPSKPPRILMTGFGASSVDWDISVWIDDPWASRMRSSELRKAIWWALKDAGITIAFPQVDVHLHHPPAPPPVPEGD